MKLRLSKDIQFHADKDKGFVLHMIIIENKVDYHVRVATLQ